MLLLTSLNMMCAARQRRVKWLQAVQTPQLHRSLCPAKESRTAVPCRDLERLGDRVSGAQLHLGRSFSLLLWWCFFRSCLGSKEAQFFVGIAPCGNYFGINPRIRRLKPDASSLTFRFNLTPT